MKILALDPATHTGWAHTCGNSGTFDLSVRRDESGGMRLIRLRANLKMILDTCGIDLLVYESVKVASAKMQQTALILQSEIQGTIKVFCEDSGVEYRGYTSSEVKKFATGKGNAGKPLMEAFARSRWPDRLFRDDNEIDALWLLELATRDYCGGG